MTKFENGFRVPGLLLACSSPKGEDDFINSRINRESKNPAVLVIDNVAEWDVKDKGYSGKKFFLFIGNDEQDGRPLHKGDKLENFDPELILKAPIETLPEFEKDFIGALRDIAGRRSVPATSLFKSRDKLAKAFSGRNIFKKDIISLDVRATLDDIKPYLDMDFIKMCLTRKYSRYIGIDFGLNGDKFGLAMGYAKYPDNVEYSDDRYIDKEYVIEGAVSFKAKTKEGVPSAAVRQLIRYFRNLGFPIQLITADKPGQVMLQDLLRDGFVVQYLSVDVDRRPYFVLKDQVSLGSITGPDSALLKWECVHIIDDGKKCDHPDKVIGGWDASNAGITVPGSKDLSDACLLGNTEIYTKEYSYITMEDLANKGIDNEFTILSKDEQGKTIETKAYNAHKTKETKELVEIELETGLKVICTPDHRILLKNGTYKEAQDLTEDDEIMDNCSWLERCWQTLKFLLRRFLWQLFIK